MNEPNTLMEAIAHFADPDRALFAFVALRWPTGVWCPRCGMPDPSFISTRRIWKCKSCRRQFSAKVGTVMEDSPLGLDKWMTGIWLVANAKNGISSHEIGRALGITQKSAWFMAHRIRHALMMGSFDKLDGEVEVDQTFIGPDKRKMNEDARERFERLPEGTERTVVQSAVERGGDARSRVIADTSRRAIHGAVRDAVEPGSQIYTDEHVSFDRLDGYERATVNHGEGQYRNGDAYTNTVEGYFNLFKRCVKGTWISVSPWHTNRYLADQDFRWNERKADDGRRFRMATRTVTGRRMTYARLTSARVGRGPVKGYDWRAGR